MLRQQQISISTRGRSTTNITRDIEQAISDSGIQNGLCHVFIHHTSASLMLCENADPDVRADLDRFMARLVPDGDRLFDVTFDPPNE